MKATRFGRAALTRGTLAACAGILLNFLATTQVSAAQGANWLAAQAQPDGAIVTPSGLATPLQATAEALRALHASGSGDRPEALAAQQYLAAESYHNTETLSRKIIAATLVTADTSVLVQELVASQEWTGGFGELAGYAATPLDTAFALEALTLAGGSPEAIQKAVGYLLSTQAQDGSWHAGRAPSVYVTALAAQALGPYRSRFVGVSSVLAAARDFLLSKRLGDGTWGEPFLTAHSLLASIPLLTTPELVSGSIAQLQAEQSPDGDWLGDVYTTALAIRALALYSAENSGTGTPAPDAGSITGTVHAAGSTGPLTGVSISVNEVPGASIQTGSDGSFALTGLAPGTYTLVLEKSGYGPVSLIASVEAGQITNTGSHALGLLSDFGFLSGTVSGADTGSALADVEVTVTASASNIVRTDESGRFEFGELGPGDYQLSFSKTGYSAVVGLVSIVAGQTSVANVVLSPEGSYDDAPGNLYGRVLDGSTGLPVVGASVDLGNGIAAVSGSDGTFTLTAVPRGSYQATATASGYQRVSLTVLFPPSASGALGDLSLYPEQDSTPPTELTLAGTVVDAGTGARIPGATVEIPHAGLSAVTGADGSFTLSGISALEFEVVVAASGYGTAKYALTVEGFGAAQVTLPLSAHQSEEPESPYTVAGQVLDTTTNLPLPGARIIAEVNGTLRSAVADTEGRFLIGDLASEARIEFRADGYYPRFLNVALGKLTITDLGQILLRPSTEPLPDLVVENVDLSGAETDARSLTFSGTVTAHVSNVGAAATGVPVELLVFYDMNQSGVYDPKIDVLLGQEPLSGPLNAVASAEVVIDVFGGLPYRDAPIKVWVDSAHAVEEADEQNNVSSSQAACRVDSQETGESMPAPDLTASILAVHTPAGGQLPTLRVRVGNAGAAVETGVIQVSFYDGDPGEGGQLVGSFELDGLAGDSYRDVELESAAISGQNPVFAVVDAAQAIRECDEANNLVSVPAPRVLADLVVNEVTAQLDQHEGGPASGNVVATIANKGSLESLGGVKALAYFDVDADGGYREGVDVALGETLLSAMSVGETRDVTIPVRGSVPFRDAPIHVWVDSLRELKELREDNNTGSTALACRIEPLPSGSLKPVLKWHWSGSPFYSAYRQVMSTPVVAQLNDDNGDGVIDSNDIPDVIFSTYSGSNYGGNGILRAVSGATGEDIWPYNLPPQWAGAMVAPAVADIDGDGLVEIVVSGPNRSGLRAYEHDGTLKWRVEIAAGGSHPAIADLDGDGVPEIVYGARVFNVDGSLRWDRGGSTGPLVLDLDLDGKMEIVANGRAYTAEGDLLWDSGYRGDLGAVGNFDDDDYPEIAIRTPDSVTLLEHDGTLKWGPKAVPGGGGGPLTIADMDGDGEPEIGVAGGNYYVVFETDGTVKWTSRTRDYSSRSTGSSVFDFEGDGQAEVLYSDENYFRIYEGATGRILFETRNPSGTIQEYPVVADIDNDGHAEIVVVSNNMWFWGANGVRVFESANDDWMPTRSIWNQHTYHITNVNDDGTIPRHEQPSWLTHNTYRLNTFAERNARDSADLTVGKLSAVHSVDGEGMRFTARVGNAGLAPSSSGVKVEFFSGDPVQGGTSLGSVSLDSVPGGRFVDVRLDGVTEYVGDNDLYAVVDADDTLAECNESNNVAVLPAGAPGMEILGAISPATDHLVYGPHAPVVLQAAATNTGAIRGTYTATLSVEDLGGMALATFPAHPIEGLAPGAEILIAEAWDTADYLAGTYRLRAVLYAADGHVLDESLVNFAIVHGTDGGVAVDLRTRSDRAQYHTSDEVVLENLVRNLSTNLYVEGSVLSLRVLSPSGLPIFSTEFPLSPLYPGADLQLSVPFGLRSAAEGAYTVQSQVIGGDGEQLAAEMTQFDVIESLQRSLLGDVNVLSPRLYQGEAQVCTFGVRNEGLRDISQQTLRWMLVDIAREEERLGSEISVELGAGSSTSFVQGISTGDLKVGPHACVLQASIEDESTTLGYKSFLVDEAPISIDAGLGVGTRGRVLILLDGVPPSGTADPHGPQGAPATAMQRTYLESLLGEAGWSYTIVETAEAFERELNSGGYAVYALLAEHEKLSEQTQKVLREAVHRGEGLLLGGRHDQRNGRLEPALGLVYRGKLPDAHGVAVDESPLHPVGSDAFALPDKALRVELAGAEPLGSFSGTTLAPEDRTALTEYGYGEGRSVYFGYDLLAEAALAGADSLHGRLILAALAHVHPETVEPLAGGVIPLRLTLTNEGIATPGRVLVRLPAGTAVVDASAGAPDPNAVVPTWVWPYTLAEEQTLVLDLWVRLPEDGSTQSVEAVVQTGIEPEFEEYETVDLLITPQLHTGLGAAIGELAAASDKALKTVLNDLRLAQRQLDAADHEAALAYLLKATDRLMDMPGAEAYSIRLMLDRAIWEAALSIE